MPKIGKNVVIHDGATVGENVTIGDNSVIYSDVILEDNVTIGPNNVIGIVAGGNDRMRKDNQSITPLVIKSGTKTGSLVALYAGTTIGQSCFFGDLSSVRENVTIGDRTVIGRSAIVELNTTIGSRCTVQTGAYVTGDSIVEDDVFIGPCVSMSNDKYMGARPFDMKGPHIKRGAKIGNNATLLPGVVIGVETIVGAGAVVTKNTKDQVTVAGVPAKELS
ncbi:acyltransferase [Geomicrobium sp. JCM 19038]|uniref:acyltransferase n=1 Tax=Geomicrobium sp. JCM 19038 TaxID=1460635 RepID=UPI00045F27AA|nr:N-acetyltransferase [Geomicrobium sp. JCM 19038]GAK08923.1 UDP-3-O-[3-hydroxymyristoyl] glucosamine N-acyltransferase [Geomicrobium sp. JCM 19038]